MAKEPELEKTTHEDKYLYETKCRVCGAITKWFYQYKKICSIDSWVRFRVGKLDFSASTYHCIKCERETIQDVVSFIE